MEEKLLKTLWAQAYQGACRVSNRKELAQKLGISVGELAGLLYTLNADGRILQDHDLILLLSDSISFIS